MPARTLPTIPIAEVKKHSSAKSCYVTVGNKVYDVTEFVDSHPGGPDYILDHAGEDVKKLMEDEISHLHSESAYEILDEDYLIGFLPTEGDINGAAKTGKANGLIAEVTDEKPLYAATGMSSEADLSKETDYNQDYKTHKFLDLSKPLLMQVWNGGFDKDFYLEQVHRPRHYKGGDSAPLFGNFLEPLSKTPWWVVPTIWVPPVAYLTYVTSGGIGVLPTAGYWLFGLAFWTLIEYVLHRCLFHLDYYLPNNRVGLTAHFLLHGIHHYLPMDKYRLVMPPTLFVVLCAPFWKLAHAIFFYNWYAAAAAFAGGVFGYICYDLTHYFLHHRNLPSYYRGLKKYHLAHHFADYNNGFGVSNRFWDWVFNTELEMTPPKVLKTN